MEQTLAIAQALTYAEDLRELHRADSYRSTVRMAMRLTERVAPDLADNSQLEYGFLALVVEEAA